MERLYRLLLRLYPRHRRRQDGDEMAEMFDDICRYEPESRGLAGRTRLTAATLRDVVGGAVSERLPFFDILVQDLRYGLRRLRDNPTLTVAAVLTLAIGIGAVTSVYSIADAMLLNPLPWPEVDRVVAIGEVTPRRGLEGEGWTHGGEFRLLQQADTLETVAGLTLFYVTMTGAGDPEEIIGWRASPEFFDVMGVAPEIGRVFGTGVSDADTVVLGHAFWRRRFDADPGVIGRSVRLGEREYTVIGVMPRGARFPMGTDLWVPLRLTPQQLAYREAASDGGVSLRAVARLAPGATIEQLRAELGSISAAAAEAAPTTHEDTRLDTEPIVANLNPYGPAALGLLMGAAGFLLLLVCGNVANMQLAQAEARREEMAMRMALGAPRARLVRQLLTESVALATLAAIAGTVLVIWCASGVRSALGHERWRLFFIGVENVGINTTVLAFAALVALGSVILFGLVPALQCSGVALNEALKQSGERGGRARGRLRPGLVVLEVALSVVLLVGAGLMAVSIGALARVDTDIDTEAITVRLLMPPTGYEDAARQRAFASELIERVESVAGIDSVSLTNRGPLPGAGNSAFDVQAADADSSRPVDAHRHIIAGNYFDTLGIALISGRIFDRRDTDGAPGVAIISVALADRLWPGEPPVGRELRVSHDDSRLTVVGVVANVARAWNDPRPAYSVYVPHAQSPRESMTVMVRTAGNRPAPADALRDAVHAIDPDVVVFGPATIEAGIEAQTAPTRALSNMVGWMAVAALLVCLSGIYALVSHAAGRRTREVGVRMALGANADQVVGLLVRQGLRTSGLGLLIGLLLAVALTNFLVASTRGLVTIDARVFALLAAGMLVLAAASSWLPARRAARVDPASTLRSD